MSLDETLQTLKKCNAPNRYLTFFCLDDVKQEIELANWLYRTETAKCRAIQHAMRVLRHELHSGVKPPADPLLRPSKNKYRSGYRRNHENKKP